MTKKSIKLKELREISNGENLYFTGYCKLQSLLKNVEPEYYYSNVYGWRFDVYIVNGLIITTGYESPRIAGVKELKEIDKFENLERENSLNAKNWEQEKENNLKLLSEFCRINGGF